MKTRIFIISAFTAASVLFLSGCDNSREKKVEDAKEKVNDANAELTSAQAEYDRDYLNFKNTAEARIAANEKSIEEFKAEMKLAGKKFQAKYATEIAALEQKNKVLKQKVTEYKYDGKDKWEDFKIGFNKDMEATGDAIKEFFAKKNK